MTFKHIIQVALRNLLANKVRAAQSMLAVIVGVAAVLTVLGVGSSLVNLNKRLDNEYAPGLISTFVGVRADGAKRITVDWRHRYYECDDLLGAGAH